MKRGAIAGGAIVFFLLAVVAGYRAFERDVVPAAATPSAIPPPPAPAAGEKEAAEALAKANPGFLYGRVTTNGGSTYEGRLRWGDGEEGFWGDYFNGAKQGNNWAAQVPLERLPKERSQLEIFGFVFPAKERPIGLGRPFMARFGDIARIEAQGLDVRVTLKSGTVFDLDRLEASDFDDGVRVWEDGRRSVALGAGQIHTIDLLPTARLGAAPNRLHGTVRTRRGDFSGFLQWDRKDCVGSDILEGRTGDGELGLRFDTLRSIARHSPDSSRVTLLDGREVVLSGNRQVGDGNRGIYVDDQRYGRVLISWDAFERVDFSPGGSGPAYDSFPPGRPLTGSVTTRAGRRLAGRLVYDLDESETTDTLDAPSQGVDYTLPFGLVASIALPGGEQRGPRRASVTLHTGEQLELELTGDLGEGNAGLLVFVDGRQSPEYVPWGDVKRVDIDRPPAMYPPLGGG